MEKVYPWTKTVMCKGRVGGPNGIRTRVTDVRGRCPRPLDDGTFFWPVQVKLFRETKSKVFNKLNKSDLINLKLTKKQIINQDQNKGSFLMQGVQNPIYPLRVGATLAALWMGRLKPPLPMERTYN